MSADRAIDWLCAHQESDGSWDAKRWGGQARFQVALTALPMLAIEATEATTPTRVAAVRRSTAWLSSQQRADGTFGAEFSGAPYNRSIATLALIRASAWETDPSFDEAVNRALDALVARQTADGGWGYEFSARADRSITEWHVEALEAALTRGRDDLRPHLNRAQAWLAAQAEASETRDEPADSPSETLPQPSAGALDFYGAYFLTARLQAQGDLPSQQRLAGLRRTILVRQITGGSEAGTWSPDDRWGRAGGRLYSTALAALTLRGR
jgi:squalene cyclase